MAYGEVGTSLVAPAEGAKHLGGREPMAPALAGAETLEDGRNAGDAQAHAATFTLHVGP